MTSGSALGLSSGAVPVSVLLMVKRTRIEPSRAPDR